LDSERGIAWRAADSLALRDFLGLALTEAHPGYSTVSRTRRLIGLETHQAVFTWVLQCIADSWLLKGKKIGIDAITLKTNAALRSIVRRETGDNYQEFLLKGLKNPALKLLPERILLINLSIQLIWKPVLLWAPRFSRPIVAILLL
jgi:hypothetical protein